MAKPQRRRRQDEDRLRRAQTANQKARAQLREEQEKQSRILEQSIKKNITMLSRNLVSPAEEARRDIIGFEIALEELLKVEKSVSKANVEERKQILNEYEASLTSLYEQKSKNTIVIVESFRQQIDTIFQNSQKEPLKMRNFAIKEKYIKQIDVVIENIKNFKSPDLQENVRQLLLKDAESVKQTFEDSISIFGKVKLKTKRFVRGIKDFSKIPLQGALGSQGLGQSGLGKWIASGIQAQIDKTPEERLKTNKKYQKLLYEQDILQQKQQQLSPEAITLDPSQDGTGTPVRRGRRSEASEVPDSTKPPTRLGIVAKTKGLEQQTFNIKIEKILLRHQGLLECICENSKTIVQDLELRRRQKQEAQDESAFETQETSPTATRDAEKETDKKKKGIFGLLATAGTFLLNKLKSLTGFFTRTVTTLLKGVWKLLSTPFRLLAGLVRQVLSSVSKSLLRLGAQLLARITAFALSPAAIFAAAGAAGAYATAKIGEAIGGKASGTASVYRKAREYGLSQEGGTLAISKRIRDYERAKNLPISKQGRLFNENGKIVELEETDPRLTGASPTTPTPDDAVQNEAPESVIEPENMLDLDLDELPRGVGYADGTVSPTPSASRDTGQSNAARNTSTVTSTPSERLIDTIRRLENAPLRSAPAGTTTKAFFDEKQYSIGYGTPSSANEVITKEEAESRLKKRVAEEKAYVLELAQRQNRKWSNDQIEALTSFSYNLGRENLKRLTASGRRSDEEIAQKMLEYNKAGGKINTGLTTRRQEEQALFQSVSAPVDVASAGAPSTPPSPPTTGEPSPTTSVASNKKAPLSFSREDAERMVSANLEKGLDEITNFMKFMDPTQKGRQELTEQLARSGAPSTTGNIDSSTTVAQTNQNNFYGAGMSGGRTPVDMEPIDPSLRQLIG